MKILLLADPLPSHTIKWANSLSKSGIEILLFGLNKPDQSIYDSSVYIETFNISREIQIKGDGNLSKIIYLTAVHKLKDTIRKFNPDILHAHYASSYGLIGALTKFHPYYLSVWGNDIFDFPKKSLIHKKILRYVLKKSDIIFSTSEVMKIETNKYVKKPINVIPFGVDIDIFQRKKIYNQFTKNDIVIGTVKTLEPNYGIHYLIEAFHLLKKKYDKLSIKLLIVGSGSLDVELKYLAGEYLGKDIIFTGKIAHSKISEFHNMLDIAVYPSVSESFGVSIVESMACEVPVVTSNVGGIPEIVENGKSGFIVTPKRSDLIANVLEKLIHNPDLTRMMGIAARERVVQNFNWNNNVKDMIGFYNNHFERKT